MSTTEAARLAVDLNTAEMTALFRSALVYRKTAVVVISAALAGETIVTVTADGTEETRRVCQGGEPVITNPGGEEYVPQGGWPAVERRYSKRPDGRWEARGLVRAFPNPAGCPVRVTTRRGACRSKARTAGSLSSTWRSPRIRSGRTGT